MQDMYSEVNVAHQEQIVYCKKIKRMYPELFENRLVLDIGSLDINGNNRYLFSNSKYTGVDIEEGRNVDVVSMGHEYNGPDESFDFIISTECFEHDMHYKLTLRNICRMLKPRGMFLFTCATTGRKEHGTLKSNPHDSPLTTKISAWSNYYKNLTKEDIHEAIDLENIFQKYEFEINEKSNDLYFYGIKK